MTKAIWTSALVAVATQTALASAQPLPVPAPGPGVLPATELAPRAAPPQAIAHTEEDKKKADAQAKAAAKKADEERYVASAKRVQEAVDDVLDIPEVPAAFALGLSADVVARPATLREVTGAIKTILGPDGKLIPGVALEVAPFYRLVTRDATAEQWASQTHRPLLGGFRLSLATASDPLAADPSNAATLLAFGARLGYDATDARFHADAVKQLKAALPTCAPPNPPENQTPPEADHPFGNGAQEGAPTVVTNDACKDGAYSKMEKDIIDDLSGFRLEAAGNVIAADREVNDADSKYRGFQTWAAVEYRFSSGTGLGAGVDYKLQEVPGPNLKALRLGGRFNQDSKYFSLSLGGAYARRTALGPMADTSGDNWFDLGGSLAGKVENIGALVVGTQWMKNLDRDQSDLIILVSVTSSKGDKVVDKVINPQ